MVCLAIPPIQDFIRGRFQPLTPTCAICLVGSTVPFVRNVFTLNTCSHIAGSQVLEFKSEDQLLAKWQAFVAECDPDLVIGYNTSNFDMPYLLDRAKALKVSTFPYLGRMRSNPSSIFYYSSANEMRA